MCSNKLRCCLQFQNGAILNETYPAELNSMSNTQPATHLHPSEAGPYPDLTSSGFL